MKKLFLLLIPFLVSSQIRADKPASDEQNEGIKLGSSQSAIVPDNEQSVDYSVETGSRPDPTVVTSDRLQVDYANNMGTFEGNVLAIDPRITVRADRMIVMFGSETNETKSIQRIVAEGSVVVTQDNRKSTSDRAEYTAKDGKVILTGKPFVETPEGTVTGEKITFWRGLQKMDVESASQLVIHPDQTRSILQDMPEHTQ